MTRNIVPFAWDRLLRLRQAQLAESGRAICLRCGEIRRLARHLCPAPKAKAEFERFVDED